MFIRGFSPSTCVWRKHRAYQKSILYLLFLTQFAYAVHPLESDQGELKRRVLAVTAAQNKVLKAGSTLADVDALFAMYTEDFVYQHEAYGGVYSRKNLYDNTIKFLQQGRYTLSGERYTVLTMIEGLNAVAVEREEINEGGNNKHLAVFEFRGDKVSKIIEYWQ